MVETDCLYFRNCSRGNDLDYNIEIRSYPFDQKNKLNKIGHVEKERSIKREKYIKES